MKNYYLDYFIYPFIKQILAKCAHNVQVSVVGTSKDTEINWTNPKELEVSKGDDASTFILQNRVDSDNCSEGCLEMRMCVCVRGGGKEFIGDSDLGTFYLSQ